MELQLTSGVHSAPRPTPPLSLCLSLGSGGSSVAEPLRAVAPRAGTAQLGWGNEARAAWPAGVMGWEQFWGWMCHQPHEGSVNIKQPQACQTGFQARAAWRPGLTGNQAGSVYHDCPQSHSAVPSQGL